MTLPESIDGILDFSAVRRIDAQGLHELEALAAGEPKPVLRNVNVDVYKVLVLTKLAPRLRFLD